jgi:hypothetical protein
MNLIKEIPNQTETDRKIARWHIRRRIEVIARERRVKMLYFEENSGSLNLGVNEEIEVGVIANFFFVLNEKFPNYRIVFVG